MTGPTPQKDSIGRRAMNSSADKLQRASIQSIATSLGIVIDKFTKDAQKQSDTSLFEPIAKAAGGFKVE